MNEREQYQKDFCEYLFYNRNYKYNGPQFYDKDIIFNFKPFLQWNTLPLFSPEFKAKVALVAIKEQQTIAKLAQRFAISPTQIAIWKKEFLSNASATFLTNLKPSSDEAKERELPELLGQKEIEISFLKKSLEECLGN